MKQIEKFEYKIVAFVNVINSNRGPVNLGAKNIIGARQSQIARKVGNQRVIEEYLVRVGMDGWELVTAFD